MHQWPYQKWIPRAFKIKYTPMQFYQSLLDLSLYDRRTMMVYSEEKKNFSGSLNPFKLIMSQTVNAI